MKDHNCQEVVKLAKKLFPLRWPKVKVVYDTTEDSDSRAYIIVWHSGKAVTRARGRTLRSCLAKLKKEVSHGLD